MKMRIQWEKMEFSRCTLFAIRCATKTRGALANIKMMIPRESTSTLKSITCDYPASLRHSDKCEP